MSQIDFTQLIRQLQDQQAAVREEELARHAQLMDFASGLSDQVGAMGTYGQANQQIQQVGQAASQRINQGAQQQLGQAEQDLISRGLGNTTVRESVKRGVEDDRQRAQGENDERIAGLRSGLLERQAGLEFQAGVNEIDTALSRQTQHPDPSLFANLISQAASQSPERQEIFIGPGSSSYGSQFRAQSSGGGGTSSGGSGVQTFTNNGGGGGLGSLPSGGPRMYTRSSSSSSPPGGGQGSRYATTGSGTAGPSIATYGSNQPGNVRDAAVGGRVFGPNIPAGTTYQGHTGGGMPIFNNAGGAITNDPSQSGLSQYMRPGGGFITGPGGTQYLDREGGMQQNEPLQEGGAAAPPPADAPEDDQGFQVYYKPGIMGWSDFKSRSFPNAAAAEAAGYGYTREQFQASRGY